jgi:hypothetical protein
MWRPNRFNLIGLDSTNVVGTKPNESFRFIMVINQVVSETPVMATYALHADSKNEERVAHERNLAQINADLRALYDVSPRLYDHAVKYTLKPTTTRLHELTEAAIELALEIGQEV